MDRNKIRQLGEQISNACDDFVYCGAGSPIAREIGGYLNELRAEADGSVHLMEKVERIRYRLPDLGRPRKHLEALTSIRDLAYDVEHWTPFGG